jgi:hypothetical protein
LCDVHVLAKLFKKISGHVSCLNNAQSDCCIFMHF